MAAPASAGSPPPAESGCCPAAMALPLTTCGRSSWCWPTAAASASENENPELFWAVRGAGANFCVATAFEFTADEIGDVGWVWIVLTAADPEGALRRYAELASAAPRDTTIFLVTRQPGEDGAQILLFGIVDSPDCGVAASRAARFGEFGEPVQHQVVTIPYAEVMGMAPDVGPSVLRRSASM